MAKKGKERERMDFIILRGGNQPFQWLEEAAPPLEILCYNFGKALRLWSNGL
jgi:hypothetical protein